MDQEMVPDKIARRWITIAMVISNAFLLIALTWTWRLGMQANELDHLLFHANDGISNMEKTLHEMKVKKL